MTLLSNPLFSILLGLTGLCVGVLLGRWSREREWAKREQLMKESFEASRGMGCWVKAQVDAGEG